MGKKLAFVTCRIDPDHREELGMVAEQLGRSVSEFARSLIERELARQGKRGALSSQAELLSEWLEETTRLISDILADGTIDAVETGQLTQRLFAIGNELWSGRKDAA